MVIKAFREVKTLAMQNSALLEQSNGAPLMKQVQANVRNYVGVTDTHFEVPRPVSKHFDTTQWTK